MVRCKPAVLAAVVVAVLTGGCSSTQEMKSTSASPNGKPVAAGTIQKVSKKTPTVAAAPAPKAAAQTNQKIVPLAPASTVAAKPASKATAKVATAPASRATATSSKAPGLVLSLGAGDSLGRAVYVNDVILAAKAAKRQSEFADVQPKNDGN